MNKKADGGFSLIITVVAIFLVVWWLVSVSQRECNKNTECNSESYCGSDFACHQYPNIQKTVIQYNFFLPSVIVAIALILAAVILRWDSIFKKETEPEEVVHIEHVEIAPKEEEKEYYKSNNIKSP